MPPQKIKGIQGRIAASLLCDWPKYFSARFYELTLKSADSIAARRLDLDL
jgi:hypothetical protein